MKANRFSIRRSFRVSIENFDPKWNLDPIVVKLCFWRKTFQSRRPHLIVALPPAADMVSLTFFNTTRCHISWIKYSVSYISQAYHILYIWTGSSPRLPSMWGSTCLWPTPSLSGQSRWQEQGTRSWWWNWRRFWIMLILFWWSTRRRSTMKKQAKREKFQRSESEDYEDEKSN